MFVAHLQQPPLFHLPLSYNSCNKPKKPVLHNSRTSRNSLCCTPAATASVEQQLQNP